MSSDVLVSRAKEAAQSSDWSSLSHYLRRISVQNALADAASGRLQEGVRRSPSPHSSSELSTTEASDNKPELIRLALYALQFADFQVRWDIAKLIPSFGSEAIAPLSQLIEPATEEEDWDLLWFVARILGEFRTEETVQTLRHLMMQVDQPDLVGIVIQALANIGELAIPSLTPLLRDEETRLVAAQTLAQMNHRAATEILIQVSHDENPEVRALAINAIGHLHEPQIRELLTEALADPSAQVRQAAVQGLGLQVAYLDEQEFLTQINPLLWDVDLNVRRQTIQMLGRLHSAAAADALNEALHSAYTPEILKPNVVHGLVWTETEAALRHLQQFVQTTGTSSQFSSSRSSEGGLESAQIASSSICCEIAATLGQVRSSALKPVAAEILTWMLERCAPLKKNALLKQKIAFSLGQLALPVAIAPLTQLLNDDDLGVRRHAAAALKMT